MNTLASTDSDDPGGPRPSMCHGYHIGQVVVGRYRLSQKIAHGSMGAVWLARDVCFDLQVAVKLLHQATQDPSYTRLYFADRLIREARATSAVRHPAVVRVLDFGIDSAQDPYFVMELLDGQSLGRRIRRGGRVIPERAVQVLLPIADGLSAAHGLGIVHRDIKPDNLYLAKEGHGRIQPKAIDFGLAKISHGTVGHVATGAGVLGTPEYMAPEQVIDSSTVDHRADIWGYCAVLYEMLSGAAPFNGQTCPEVLRAVLDRQPVPLTSEIDLDDELWGIIERGLRKDRSERWSSMHELGTALANWLTSRGVTEDVTGASLRTQWPTDATFAWSVSRSDQRLSTSWHSAPAAYGKVHAPSYQLAQDAEPRPRADSQVCSRR